MRVSVIIPSIYRPVELRRCVEAVLATADCEVICSLSRGDDESRATLRGLHVVVTAEHEPLTGGTIAVNEAARVATGDAFAFIGDDCVPQHGWLETALETLGSFPEESGVIGLNDQRRGPYDGRKFATHYLVTRDFCLRYNGGVLWCPHYWHYYTDVELCARARALHRYHWSERAVVRHDRRSDAVIAAALPHYENDKRTYHTRESTGFPTDYDVIL